MRKTSSLNIWSLVEWIKSLILGKPVEVQSTDFKLLSTGGEPYTIKYGGTLPPTQRTGRQYLEVWPLTRREAAQLIPRDGWVHLRFF